MHAGGAQKSWPRSKSSPKTELLRQWQWCFQKASGMWLTSSESREKRCTCFLADKIRFLAFLLYCTAHCRLAWWNLDLLDLTALFCCIHTGGFPEFNDRPPTSSCGPMLTVQRLDSSQQALCVSSHGFLSLGRHLSLLNMNHSRYIDLQVQNGPKPRGRKQYTPRETTRRGNPRPIIQNFFVV